MDNVCSGTISRAPEVINYGKNEIKNEKEAMLSAFAEPTLLEYPVETDVGTLNTPNVYPEDPNVKAMIHAYF